MSQDAKESREITHPSIKDGWFREISETICPGQASTLKVEKVLHHEKSLYQDVLVFKSTNFGNVLVLDNMLQCTEANEYSYHEMITNLAMNSHANPKKVLIIGGGDGGVLREVLKHESVEEAWLCEIDEAVIRVSKEFLPGMAVSFADPRANLHIGDGVEFLKKYPNTFDVIITDSSDPEGPAEELFKKPYFELLNNSLTSKGVISTQAESVWLHEHIITGLKKACSEIFPTVAYASQSVPFYPAGNIGYMVCSKNKDVDVTKPLRYLSEEEEFKRYRFYSKKLHEASFVLPIFVREYMDNI
ncbi:spermidine synthase Ecym_3464 [Eremothecium cymbalariae DBVPG|uniref:PABS domain-containing protein n=1 Tax=Eremothecium cymbalariae (strain CBS 270.75 / DBVPG 7215 / KCTC 17166 / NRRL Y-17582) TaxID=931890 RepID=G8JS28_ERECY|nr:Hypothetical protein Ecym_3464 [Eremothecium cymbalariae DBVPG\